MPHLTRSRLHLALSNADPLRGSKLSDWEGGIRVVSFLSGGYLPAARQGKALNGLIAMADWVATFASMAGVVPSDPLAAAAGLPPLDSIDMTDYIFGRRPDSPRTEIQVDSNVLLLANRTSPSTPDKIWKLFSTDWYVFPFRPRAHPPLQGIPPAFWLA